MKEFNSVRVLVYGPQKAASPILVIVDLKELVRAKKR